MENNNEIIIDLKGLASIVNDGKEGYESASETTDNLELKAVFLKYSSQRAGYEMELKEHIAVHGGDTGNENGAAIDTLQRTRIDIKEALTSKDDMAILSAIEAGERTAIKKYDSVLQDFAAHADHMVLLQRQRDGILDALKEIETLHFQREA